MSSQDNVSQFRKFSYKIILIGLLAILSILFVIINFIFNFRPIEFRGLWTILIFISFFWPFGFWAITASIIQIILNFTFLFILGNIKKVAYALYNGELIRMHSKMITISIMRIIGFFIYAIVNDILISHLITTRNFYGLAYAMVGLGGAFVILIVAAILDIQVWENFRDIFSYVIKAKKAKSGATLCMVGATFNIIPLFWFIGEIFKIIGYYMLSNLRNIDEGSIVMIPQPAPQQMQLSENPKQGSTKKFCANCGTALKGIEKFCTSCGLKI